MANGILNFSGGGYPQWLLDLLNPQAGWMGDTIGGTGTFADPFIDQFGTMDLNPLLAGMDAEQSNWDATPYDIQDVDFGDEQQQDDQSFVEDYADIPDIDITEGTDLEDETFGISGEDLGLGDDSQLLRQMDFQPFGADDGSAMPQNASFASGPPGLLSGLFQAIGLQPPASQAMQPFQPAGSIPAGATPGLVAAGQSMQPSPSPRAGMPTAAAPQQQQGGYNFLDRLQQAAPYVLKGLSPYSKIDPVAIERQRMAADTARVAQSDRERARAIQERGMQLRENAARDAAAKLQAQQKDSAGLLGRLKEINRSDPDALSGAMLDFPNASPALMQNIWRNVQELNKQRNRPERPPSLWTTTPEGGVTYKPGVVEAEEAKAAATVRGRERAEAQAKAEAQYPDAMKHIDDALQTIQQLRQHPGKQFGVGFTGAVPPIWGTRQAGFVALHDQAVSQVFPQAYNVLRGTGPVATVEGENIAKGYQRLKNRAQDPADYWQAVNDLENSYKRARKDLLDRAKERGDTRDVGREGREPDKKPTGLSERDQQALKWANANPNDPRAVAIKRRLGVP